MDVMIHGSEKPKEATTTACFTSEMQQRLGKESLLQRNVYLSPFSLLVLRGRDSQVPGEDCGVQSLTRLRRPRGKFRAEIGLSKAQKKNFDYNKAASELI